MGVSCFTYENQITLQISWVQFFCVIAIAHQLYPQRALYCVTSVAWYPYYKCCICSKINALLTQNFQVRYSYISICLICHMQSDAKMYFQKYEYVYHKCKLANGGHITIPHSQTLTCYHLGNLLMLEEKAGRWIYTWN